MNAIEQAIEALETAQRFIPESAYRESYDKCTEAITALQSMQGEAVGWRTEDYDTDKSATTYDSDCADRWRAKGWPVESLYTQPKSPAVVDRAALIELIAATSRQSEGVTADLIIAMLTASGKGE